jgi:Tfp pilus assembly major pilin PilA
MADTNPVTSQKNYIPNFDLNFKHTVAHAKNAASSSGRSLNQRVLSAALVVIAAIAETLRNIVLAPATLVIGIANLPIRAYNKYLERKAISNLTQATAPASSEIEMKRAADTSKFAETPKTAPKLSTIAEETASQVKAEETVVAAAPDLAEKPVAGPIEASASAEIVLPAATLLLSPIVEEAASQVSAEKSDDTAQVDAANRAAKLTAWSKTHIFEQLTKLAKKNYDAVLAQLSSAPTVLKPIVSSASAQKETIVEPSETDECENKTFEIEDGSETASTQAQEEVEDAAPATPQSEEEMGAAEVEDADTVSESGSVQEEDEVEDTETASEAQSEYEVGSEDELEQTEMPQAPVKSNSLGYTAYRTFTALPRDIGSLAYAGLKAGFTSIPNDMLNLFRGKK